MTAEPNSLMKAIKQTAFHVGIVGCGMFAAAFVVAALSHVPIKVTLTNDPKIVLEVNPVNVCEPNNIVPDTQETLIAQSKEMSQVA